jgi:hypothetical protein
LTQWTVCSHLHYPTTAVDQLAREAMAQSMLFDDFCALQNVTYDHRVDDPGERPDALGLARLLKQYNFAYARSCTPFAYMYIPRRLL